MRKAIAAFGLFAVFVRPTTAQRVHIEPPPPGGRIQLLQWTMPGETLEDGVRISDPFTQIVRILGEDAWGTGFLLENCRIMTALHVLMGIKYGLDADHLKIRESVVGNRFRFETQPIPWRNNQRAYGTFVVLGHGDGLKDVKKLNLNLEEYPETALHFGARTDWAIGYDEACFSQTLELGTFQLATEYERRLRGRSMVTAGFPGITVGGVPKTGEPLYVDTNCTLTDEGETLIGTTNCSVWHGMSGAPLLIGPLRLGNTLYTARGRPVFRAIGILQQAAKIPAGEQPAGVVTVPNFPSAWTGVTLFNDMIVEEMKPLLDGPVDPLGLRRR